MRRQISDAIFYDALNVAAILVTLLFFYVGTRG
jgi:hypothetical protein